MSYVGSVSGTSLAAVLEECLYILEIRFASFDVDGAGTIQRDQLLRGLSVEGFADVDKLKTLFNEVDLDRSGSLEFTEFFALIVKWFSSNEKGLSIFFRIPQNREIVERGVKMLWEAMSDFHSDSTVRLTIPETKLFFTKHFKSLTDGGHVDGAIQELFPESDAQLTFRNLAYVVYDVLCRGPGKLNGKYLPPTSDARKTPRELVAEAFQVLETDFRRLDTDVDHTVSFEELLAEANWDGSSSSKVDFGARLAAVFNEVDVDGSKSLDFIEFCYLAYRMTLSGAYSTLVRRTEGAAEVKRGMTVLVSCLRGIRALTHSYSIDDVVDAISKTEVTTRAQLDTSLRKVAGSRSAVVVVDVLRALYEVMTPTITSLHAPRQRRPRLGATAPGPATPPSASGAPSIPPTPTTPPSGAMLAPLSIAPAQPSGHPARIDPVSHSKFRVIKVLGQGGQGKVSLGEYEGIKVAGKTFLSTPDEHLLREVLDELSFFRKVDHRFCNYLVGAKTSLDSGGPLVLTEVCDNGSVFDFYFKLGGNIKTTTACRFSRECAEGLQYIHNLGYMHRDIKSLNVFLTSSYTCQVADFGMCTPKLPATERMGTGQWMAPEVGYDTLGRGAKNYDRRCDIYSFAILMWELFHCKIPYADRPELDQMAIIRAVASALDGGPLAVAPLRPTFDARRCPPSAQIIEEIDRIRGTL